MQSRTETEIQHILSYVDKMRFIDDWTPDATGTHLGSAAYFILNVITNDLSGW